MELTASHAIQGVLLLATVAGGYAVVKSNLARVMEDLEVFHKNFDKFKSNFDARLDDAESQRAVFSSQIDVLKDINSVSALERRNREIATMQAELKVLRQMTEHLMHIHNSKHPRTDT
jgi:predicted  nucleic acid-binding Zn-ribbon protein|tara:strand:+ start:5740 stop:6093 length:354 start_codon:yes stop_codon:yes gene_type:complete